MTTLSFSIIGKDVSASRTLQNVSKSAEKTSASLKGLKVAAAVGLVAVTAAAVKFGISSVRAYSQAQTAQVKLQDAFAKFPRLADTNITALRGLNTELARKTRFDDDATASGQAVLAQFKLTGQQITQLTPLLQDYAAKTGKDLPTAARDLGKAMLGQGRSLKAVGINFKDTGTAGGNFAQIMTGLRTQVGGFAEKEGKTAAGQAEILKNQFGELQESVGKALLPALLKVGGGLLKVVNAFNGLSDASKTTILSIGGGIVTVGLSALAIGKLAVTVRAARDAFRALGIASKTAVVGIPVLGVALAAAGAVIGVFAGRAAQAKQRTEDIGEALKGMTGEVKLNTAALDQNVRASTAKALQDAGALTAATKLGLGLDTLTDAALGNQTAIAEVHAALLAAYTEGNSVQVQAASKLSSSFGSVKKSVGDAIAKENEYRAAVGGAGTAAGTAGTKVEGAGKKVKTAGEKAADASKKLKDLATSLFKASEGALELSGSEISFEQAVDDATAAAKANGKTLDTNTQKGRDNKTALNNLVTSSQNYIRKLVETGASSKKVTAATKDARNEFIRVAEKMGIGSVKARKLAEDYFKIPTKRSTKVDAPGIKPTQAAVDTLVKTIKNAKGKQVALDIAFKSNPAAYIKALYKTFGLQNLSYAGHKAAGGPIQNLTGYGVKGKDTEPIVAAVGEHMWTAKETDAVGGHRAMYGLRKAALRGDLKGYAGGGEVSHAFKVRTGHNDPPPINATIHQAFAAQRAAAQIAGDRFAVEYGKAAAKAAAAQAKKAQASMLAPGGTGSYSGPLPGGRGAAGIRAIARALGASYIAHHIDPQGGNAYDLGSSGARNSRIGNALVSAHGRLGLRYVIRQMQIASARSSWNWRRYSPITGSGDFRHVNHVHVSYRKGTNSARPGLALVGEDGPELVRMRGGERVTPLARPYSRGGGGVTYNITLNAPNYIGSRAELKQTLVEMARHNELTVLTR